MDNENIIKILKRSNFVVRLREDNIVHVEFIDDTVIDIPLQEELIKTYNEILEGKRAPFIFTGGDFVSITKEARENSVIVEEHSPVIASAVVTHSLAQKILSEFYFMVNKPKRPYKTFTAFDDGILWLNSLDL